MTEETKKVAQEKMEKSLLALQNELKKIRTGRAQVSMLDNIRVNYYGNMSPLNQVAAISCPDAKSFLIAPWEGSILKEIESSIVKSDIGMTPMNDGKVIRLKVPDLTEERRKDLVKQTKKIVEEARVAVRMARRDANEETKKALKDKQISEDEAKKSETEIQKLTDEYIKKVDAISDEKEKSILTI
ncbi:MAG: ribosome recycling factor [Bdellovibrio sp. CG10_big_fil_rev_8_21_14_0_10_47_8]|nr:MAG: ribosome recycling factor [Bdellovibrio sp. CG10_big_fil_rev_8_21_14_0_10_47_8]